MRGTVVRGPEGKTYLYGGNFSLPPHRLRVDGIAKARAVVAYMTDKQVHETSWEMAPPRSSAHDLVAGCRSVSGQWTSEKLSFVFNDQPDLAVSLLKQYSSRK